MMGWSWFESLSFRSLMGLKCFRSLNQLRLFSTAVAAMRASAARFHARECIFD